jgi:indolepyruvate ferredoxin oxidoreductase
MTVMGSIIRPEATLEERWDATGGPVLLTGTQALVRLPMLRQEMDAALGWKTGGFISGYRGSPLGGFDKELGRQQKRLAKHDIVFQPGLNEDLAATAVWGSQQVGLTPGGRVDGVFAIWYGKGPGIDRSGDVFRHANSAGTMPKGGVIALAGDDPSSKSSTITSGCEYAFMDAEMPVLDPADVAEVLEFGLKGIALSRYAGLWAGIKCVADTMDASMTVLLDPARYATRDPVGLPMPADGLHIRLLDNPIAQEERLRHFKLPAAVAFARANGIDRIALDSPNARFGIAVRGKAYAVLRQALEDAGISEAFAREQGLRIWKVGLAWPLDAEAARAFAEGLEEILVIEDRRPVMEWQLRDALFHAPTRPRVTGKKDENGRPLLSDLTELDIGQILRALAARLPAPLRTNRLHERIAELDALASRQTVPLHLRDPYFCPGCPHNSSTKIPEGSRALAGIGCHYLAKNMDRNSDLFTQMGGEGMPWIGQAPFTTEKHVFANIGDGTWGHSGSLTVRFAVASKANMTFKVLVNSAVAMTGGQTPEGEIDVPHIAAQLHAEGVERIEIVSDDPDRHRGNPLIPAGAGFHHRSELDAVQRVLREVPGVTAIIYDQECATERRRKRKRDLAPKAERRVMINPRVCEDCGDCSRASNCLAVEPVDTEFGRKRKIDQSACNQDMSCLGGFCPSFVTLVGAKPAEHHVVASGAAPPEPVRPEVQGEAWNLLMAGVGGQGVSSLAAILAQAAHLEGRPVRSLDFLGLAQKGGGVYAQLRIGPPGASPDSIPGARIAAGGTDLLLAADMVVAHGRTARPLLGPDRTAAVVNADLAPTAQFVKNTATRYHGAEMLESIRAACRDTIALGGTTRVTEELGDAVYLNVYLLGIAYQRGLVPLSSEAIGRALELNGAQVALNKEAFARGRAAALEDLAPPAHVAETVDALVARRVADLTAYQNAGYARDYEAFVAKVRAAGDERLTRAVATQLHRLMAYKDEYEVARLHSLPAWKDALAHGFTGTQRIEMHLAPPVLAKPDPVTGVPAKRAFGPWMFRAMGLLRHGKVLRGTALDPFGRTEERRMERALPGEFRAGVERLMTNPALAAEWAEAWAGVKGFGPIKARNLAATRARLAAMEAPAIAAE